MADAACYTRRHSVCDEVYDHDHRELHAQLVDGLGYGFFLFALDVVLPRSVELPVLVDNHDLPLFTEDIQYDDSDHACHQISRGRDRKPETVASPESESLITRSDVVGLSGTLAEAHWQQQSPGPEHVRHEGHRKTYRYYESRDALHHVGADDDRSRTESDLALIAALFLCRSAQAHRYEAERDAVVCKRRQQLLVKRDDAGLLGEEQNEPSQHGNRYQALSYRPDRLSQRIGDQYDDRQISYLDDSVPQLMVCC